MFLFITVFYFERIKGLKEGRGKK